MSDDMDIDREIAEELQSLSIVTPLDALIQQAQELLVEVDKFIAYLKSKPRLDHVEYRHFRGDVKNELNAISKVSPISESTLINDADRSAAQTERTIFREGIP